MANVVITDTEKTGWIKFEYNDYYPSTVDHKIQDEIKTSITAVDFIKLGETECIEVMNGQSFSNYFIIGPSVPGFFIVDTINGVAPTSLEDLRLKLLALL